MSIYKSEKPFVMNVLHKGLEIFQASIFLKWTCVSMFWLYRVIADGY